MLSVALIGLVLVDNRLDIRFTRLAGAYMTALQKKDDEGFYDGLRSVANFIAVRLCVGVLHSCVRSLLELQWSAALTRHYGRIYFGGAEDRGAFYRLALTREVDNPDQRIVDEAQSFVDTVLSLLTSVVTNTLKICSFAGLLYEVSPAAFGGTLAYVSVGTFIVLQWFTARLMRIQQASAAQTATLRYSIVRVGENAESIAFFDGGGAEWLRFQGFHAQLLITLYESFILRECLSTLTRAISYATFAVPALLVGPAYLRGEAEFGAITQTSIAFHSVQDGLSFFMLRLPSFSRLAVNAERLNELEDALFRDGARAAEVNGEASKSSKVAASTIKHLEHAAGGPVLALNAVTLCTPPRPKGVQQTLVEGLTFSVDDGNSVVIVGPSGIGKSSLLRCVAGLWSDGSGSVQRCEGKSVFFMPQKPYMFLGTLREQLLYPYIENSSLADHLLCKALVDVTLGYILDRYTLDDTENWASVLSLGEQQRLNFARVFLQPGLQLVLLDEGSSALDPASERHLYELLSRRVRSFVSVGHRPSLRRYHSHALWLRRRENACRSGCQNQWSFLRMEEYVAQVKDQDAAQE